MNALISSLLVIAVFAVYAQVAHHQFVIVDDENYISGNPHVSGGLTAGNVSWAFTAFVPGNWHPATLISYMADVSLFGVDAGKHALVNVLLHALDSVLLFLVLRRATARIWPSAAVAALFALHPLHVESVAWVSERKDVLSTLFFLATLWFYIGYARTRSRTAYALTIVMLALGLMSKPMLVTTPFVLLLLDWWPLQRRLAFVEKLPHFALAIAVSIVTMHAQRGAIAPLPLAVRLAGAALSYVAYIAKTFWPARLAAMYPPRIVIAPSAVFAATIVLLAVTAAVLMLRRRFPFVTMGWLWYLGTLVPAIGIVQVGKQSMADRYTYIPLIGIFIAVVWLASEVVANATALAVAAAAVLAVCGWLTFRQVAYWHDSITLFRHAIDVTSDNGIAHSILGLAYLRDHQDDLGERELQTAIELAPWDDVAHRAIGERRIAQGQLDEGEREIRAALQISPNDPDNLRDLGDVLAARGQYAEAKATYARSLAMTASNATAAAMHNANGAMLAKDGRTDDAIREYEAALALEPAHYDANMNIAALLSRLDRNSEAIRHVQAAAEQRPGTTEPHIYLALMEAQSGRIPEAIREAGEALAINEPVANTQFTNATHLPPKDTNLRDWIAFLKTR